MGRLRTTLRLPEFNNPGLWRSEHRIAVTGFSRSGKTVFLTSLLSHILNHDPERFPLRGDAAIVKPTIRLPDDKCPQFDYAENRRRLVDELPGWPDKTKLATSISVDCEFSHWRFANARLTFHDVPGERFADCSMHRHNFREWSNRQLQWLSGLQERLPEVDEFLRLVARPLDDDNESRPLVLSYKKALAALYYANHKHVSPSTFVLDQEGSFVWDDFLGELKAGNFDEVANARTCGLPGEEFTPLSIRMLDTQAKVARQFEQHYENYKKRVVRQLFRTLAQCDALAVLIDIANILQIGEMACDDADKFLGDILNSLDPGQRLHHLMRRPLPTRVLRGSPITRIAFIATQIDRFHDYDHGRVYQLLECLVKQHFGGYKGAEKQNFAISSVCSAVSDKDRNILKLALESEVQEGHHQCVEKRVARLPDTPEWHGWPNKWDGETLFLQQGGFPLFPPRMPSRRGAAPDHLGLDDVFRFLLGIKG